jgi:hypothetical protein
MWIYQTQDVEKLEQMLQLAMTSTTELPSPVKGDDEDEKTPTTAATAELSTSVTTPAVGGS